MPDNTQDKSVTSKFWDRVESLPDKEQWRVHGHLAALLGFCDDLHDCWLHLPTSLKSMLEHEHPMFFEAYQAVVDLAIDLLDPDPEP